MKLEERIVEIIRKRESGWHEPKVGVYHASQIYSIISGKIKPEDFLKRQDFDDKTLLIFEIGTMYHEYLQKLLELESEIPWQIDCDGFKIVGRTDGKTKSGEYIEFKTCSRIPSEPKVEHIHQINCNLEGLGANSMYITYIEKNPLGFPTKTFLVQKDSKLIEEIKTKVGEFHKKLL